MAYFKFRPGDFGDGASLAKAYSSQTQNVDINTNKPMPLRTTASVDPEPQKAITTFSLSEVMQGGAIQKPGVASYDTYNQVLSRSLAEMLGGGDNQADHILGNQKALVPDDVLTAAGNKSAIDWGISGTATGGGGATAGGTPTPAGPVVPGGPEAETAIKWLYDKRGQTQYNGRCEAMVEQAYGVIGGTGNGGYMSAYGNFQARLAEGSIRTDTNPPRGALVFWRTSVNGHVAIALGNGLVLGTSSKEGGIGETPVTGYFDDYLGWSDFHWQ